MHSLNRCKMFAVATLLIISHAAVASYKDTQDVRVHFVSVWSASNGDVLVQTNPKHDISGLNCTNDYWLALEKSQPGFDTALAMLLSAQATQKKVVVRAQDDNGEFCRLTRIITTPTN